MARTLLDQCLESQLKVTKLDDKIQSCLNVFQNVFKFVPVKLFQYSKNVDYVFRQLTESDKDLINGIFLHSLAPFIFGQNSFSDKGLQNLYQFVVDLHSDSFFKIEEADIQHEIKVLSFIELIWKTVLDIYYLFNPLEPYFNEIIEKLNECQEALDIIGIAKPLCKDFNGLSNDLEVAISAFIIIQYYRKRLSYPIHFRFEDVDQQYILNMPTKLNDYDAAISILKEIYDNCPFNYRTYVKIAELFLDQKFYGYAKWAAYRAILICPTYIDSYSVYFGAKLDAKTYNRTISLALNCLSIEVPIFTGSKYHNFAFLNEEICEKEIIHLNEPLELNNMEKNALAEPKLVPKNLLLEPKLMWNSGEMESIQDLVESIKSSDSLRDFMKEDSIKDETHKTVGCNELKENALLSKSIILGGKTNVENKGKNKKNDVMQFKKTSREGSEAILNFSYVIAIEKYETALNFATTKGESKLGISTIEIIILKYCQAMAYIYKRTYEDIKIGITNLVNIFLEYPQISFPLVYYGQAIGFITENRFSEAKLPLNTLRDILNRNVQFRICCYPGSDKDIPESRLEELKKLVEDLMETCRLPPSPVGLCFFETSSPFHYKEIYYSDPNFHGFTHLICTDRCHLYFHNYCWQMFKENHKLRHKKDWNDFKCITPDCNGCLLKIEIVGADCCIRKEICPDFKGPLNKERLAALSNVKLKIDSKELIKSGMKRRKQSTSEKSDENDLTSRGGNVDLISKCEFPDFRLDGIPLCKKKLETADSRQKPKKAYKSSSSKVIVGDEFYSSDHERLEALRQLKHSYCNDGYTKSKQSADSLSEISICEVSDCERFKSEPLNLEKDFLSTKNYITNYIEALVDAKKCPMRLDDKYIIDNLAVMPIEAQNLIIDFGGVQAFLNESMKYIVVDDLIVPNSESFEKKVVNIDISPLIQDSCKFDEFKIAEEPSLFNNITGKPSIHKSHSDENIPVYLIIKKLMGLSYDNQLQVGRMIMDLAKATQPDYNPTTEDLAFDSISFNVNSSYKIVTKSEAAIINDIDNIRHTIESFKIKYEFEKHKNIELLNETIHLKNTKSTLLDGIASFTEANEKEKVFANDHIQHLQNDNRKLLQEYSRAKDLIALLNREITKLREDHTKIVANQEDKMIKLQEHQNSHEEELIKLKLEMENSRREIKVQKGSERNHDSSETQQALYQRPYFPRLQEKSVLNQNALTSTNFSKFSYNINASPEFPKTNNLDFMTEIINELPNMGAEPNRNNNTTSQNEALNMYALSSVNSSDSLACTIQPPFKELNFLNEPKDDVSYLKSSDFKLHLSSVYSTRKSFSGNSNVQSSTDSGNLNRHSDLGLHWQIIQILQSEFSTFKRADFTYYLTILRKENGNKLSGLKLGDIIAKFKQIVSNKKLNQLQISPKFPSVATGLDVLKFSSSQSPNAWKPVILKHDPESDYTDDICAICHEKMENDIYKLRCGHIHHFKCLEDWYKQQTTCPICRQHCPLFCDYPPLQ